MASFLGVARVVLLSLLVSVVLANADKKCQNPRIRREWRALTDTQQAEWIGAVKCLAKLPHDPRLAPTVAANVSLIPPINTSSSFYDDLVYMHMDLNFIIHFTGMFLPWHRYFVQFFEDALISKCGYTGTTPYWDWTIDAHDVFNSPFFDTSPHGVGGWGDPNNDYQINTGGFKDEIRAYPNPHHIRRNFTLFPLENPLLAPLSANDPNSPFFPTRFMINTTMTKENLDYTLTSFDGNFIGFQAYMESLAGNHPGAHMILSGDMTGFCSNNATAPECYPGSKWTPNDPLFFMHHAMIDKIWYDWQKRLCMNAVAFGGGTVAALTDPTLFAEFPTGLPPYLNFTSQIYSDGMWNNVTIWDVMDTKGDTLCYDYA